MSGAVLQAISTFLLALASFFTQLGIKLGREQEREQVAADVQKAADKSKAEVERALTDYRAEGALGRLDKGKF